MELRPISNRLQNPAKKMHELWARALGRGDDFLYRCGLIAVGKIDVGDGGYGQDFDPRVDGGNHFRHGGHSHGVRSNGTEESGLGGRFKIRSQDPRKDPPMEEDSFRKGRPDGHFLQPPAVWLDHFGKAGTPLVHIGTEKGIVPGQVDVVRDKHQVTRSKQGIQSSRGIGEDKKADAELSHDADGKGNLAGRIPFVEMKAPLHGDNPLS